MALLQGDWVTDAQKTAARLYLSHLRSRAMQEQALEYGFRPADTQVPVKTADPHNPFVRLAPYGLQVDIPTAAATPEPTGTPLGLSPLGRWPSGGHAGWLSGVAS